MVDPGEGCYGRSPVQFLSFWYSLWQILSQIIGRVSPSGKYWIRHWYIRNPISRLYLFITARKRSLGQGNIFAPVCHSVHGVGSTWAGTPRDQVHPPRPGTPPGAVHAGRYGQQAGSTHPTGMHSCLFLVVGWATDLATAWWLFLLRHIFKAGIHPPIALFGITFRSRTRIAKSHEQLEN